MQGTHWWAHVGSLWGGFVELAPLTMVWDTQMYTGYFWPWFWEHVFLFVKANTLSEPVNQWRQDLFWGFLVAYTSADLVAEHLRPCHWWRCFVPVDAWYCTPVRTTWALFCSAICWQTRVSAHERAQRKGLKGLMPVTGTSLLQAHQRLNACYFSISASCVGIPCGRLGHPPKEEEVKDGHRLSIGERQFWMASGDLNLSLFGWSILVSSSSFTFWLYIYIQYIFFCMVQRWWACTFLQWLRVGASLDKEHFSGLQWTNMPSKDERLTWPNCWIEMQ